MNCPRCGIEMEQGVMHTVKHPFWTRENIHFFHKTMEKVYLHPKGQDENCVLIHTPFQEYPDAWLCRECGLMVFSGKTVEK